MKVIGASPSKRLLVDAGPGTGKTAIACARVAWLVDEAGLSPAEIWMVSFTRTAVHELRNRIGTYLKDPAQAAGIKIATIDSHAWAIQSGFNRDAALAGSYDGNIRNVTSLIQKNEGVFQYVGNLRHLFIDEAQDVIGPRVELLLELINALHVEAGVTVLCDEAQAIYGFSEDDANGDFDGPLPDSIREFMGDRFEELELTEIHRTNDVTLRSVFSSGRKLLRKNSSVGKKVFDEVRELIVSSNHGDIGSHRNDLQNLPDGLEDTFLLFRKRGDALEASSYLNERPHRLRMSGLPAVIHDWIGLMFWDWTCAEISKSEFDERWQARLKGRNELSMACCWSILVRLVGLSTSRVSISNLARRLGGGSPPIDLTTPDFGEQGPLIGTIHGAKGREAGQVRLYLPPANNDGRKPEELLDEARVLFVGASRAKSELLVGRSAFKVHARRLAKSGRAFTPYFYNGARAAVEIGRNGDIDAEGLVGRALFPTTATAKKSQAQVISLARDIFPAYANIGTSESDWRYAVSSSQYPDHPILHLSIKVNYDMFDIARAVDEVVHLDKKKPPGQINHLRTFGTRTLVLKPDDPTRTLLHAPWCDSGFMLAPLLVGYGMAYFRR